MRQFEDALDQCVSRLLAGESLDACLARYPEMREELRPLLEVAAVLAETPASAPAPEAKARGRQRLMDALARQPRFQGGGVKSGTRPFRFLPDAA